jgi:hypothetical protein
MLTLYFAPGSSSMAVHIAFSAEDDNRVPFQTITEIPFKTL